MKKLSEVCKLVGVTRRTLQEYNKIGLLSPSHITEGGYWLYNDDAIEKLELIQIFVEAGYERRIIKDILEAPDFDLYDELDKVIELLQEKHKKIEGMINAVKFLKITQTIPDHLIESTSVIDTTNFFQGSSFVSCWKSLIDQNVAFSESEYIVAQAALPFNYSLLAIALLSKESAGSKSVQAVVDSAYNCLKNATNAHVGENLSEISHLNFFVDVVEDLIRGQSQSVENFRTMIDQVCGPKSVHFIGQAVAYYCRNRIQQFEREQKGD